MTAREKLDSLSDDDIREIWTALINRTDIDWHESGPYGTETIGYWAMMVDIERCRRGLVPA